MGMSLFGVLFLLSTMTGGATDLLDVIPADEYWRAKSAQVTEASLAAELAPAPPAGDITKLVDALGDEVAATRDAAADKIRGMGPGVVPQLLEAAKGGNPEVASRARRLAVELRAGGSKAAQVRKLMAIRTAGERKMAGLTPRLKELTAATEPFVADYAAAALAAIDGKPYVRPRPKAGADDAWLLPAGTRAIVHLGMNGAAKPPTADELNRAVKAMASMNGGGMGGGPPPDAAAKQAQDAQELEQGRAAVGQVIAVAERIGNARVDGITIGIAGDVGDNEGFVAVVVRGQYDAKALGELLAEAMGLAARPATGPAAAAGPGGAGDGDGAKREAVAGVDVFRPTDSVALLLASDTSAGFVAGPRQKVMPVEELAGLLRAGRPGPLKDVPEMAAIVAKADPTLPVWGAVHVTDGFRRAPLFAALDHVTLAGREKDGGVAFRFDAQGRNGPGVAEAVAMVNQTVAMVKSSVKPAVDQMPDPEMKRLAKIGVDLLDSVKCEADAADATRASLTAELAAPPSSLLIGMLGSMGVSGVGGQAGPPAPVPPPGPAPAPAPPGEPPRP